MKSEHRAEIETALAKVRAIERRVDLIADGCDCELSEERALNDASVHADALARALSRALGTDEDSDE